MSTLQLHADDNVAILTQATTDIPLGHKIAVREIQPDEPIVKYGQVIGFAARTIASGEHVHVHNCDYRDFDRAADIGAGARPTDFVPVDQRLTFQGFVRPDGKVGTRNYIGIVTSVNCSATAARQIAMRIEMSGILDDYPYVDGVVALTHETGCGTGGPGNEGFEVLQRTLKGYAEHPNFGAVVALGLGCEVNQVHQLTRRWDGIGDKPVTAMTIQDLGGTRKTVEAGMARVTELLPVLNESRRTTVGADKLIMAMECGGSDAFSGVTANPALGAAADLLIRNGGTAVFGETTEIYGAEHLLLRRAGSPEVAAKLERRVTWWTEHVLRDGSSINNNPSPGNKAGGLTTIMEKSLGAVAKGGTTTLTDVLEYAEPITTPGLSFMDTPGYDPVNATGLIAGGAQVLCFTTGRGSAFGCKPAPSLKLSTTTDLYDRMTEDMDINCGLVADGERSIEQMGAEILDHVLRVASGETTKSEDLGYGDNEFVPWQLSTTL